MLDFNTLLATAGLDPAQTLIVRHVPKEKRLRRALPQLVVERPELWLAYQRIQWSSLEQGMTRGRYVASFIGEEDSSAAIFAGLYRIGQWQRLTLEGYNAFPGNAELESFGMSGRDAALGECLAFELEPLDSHAEWVGKLTIEWPKPYRQWWRWAGRGTFPVTAIESESRFVRAVPHWSEVVLEWSELAHLARSWNAALAQWRGIYLIYDTARQAGYVGSACGTENILSRWRDYARTGHGGNVELRSSDPPDLRFSILQLTAQDLPQDEVITLEASWKRRLHTREFGLNRN